jgi:hypothetical protein
LQGGALILTGYVNCQPEDDCEQYQVFPHDAENVSDRGRLFPKSPSKSVCQAPQPSKIPLNHTTPITSLLKIVGIVVMSNLLSLK